MNKRFVVERSIDGDSWTHYSPSDINRGFYMLTSAEAAAKTATELAHPGSEFQVVEIEETRRVVSRFSQTMEQILRGDVRNLRNELGLSIADYSQKMDEIVSKFLYGGQEP